MTVRQRLVRWLWGNEAAVTEMWAEAMLDSDWFPRLDREFVKDLAYDWLHLYLQLVDSPARFGPADVSAFVRNVDVPELELDSVVRCVELLAHIGEALIGDGLGRHNSESVARTLTRSVVLFRRRYAALMAATVVSQTRETARARP